MKRLALFAAALFATISVSAQSYYPGENGEIKRDGYTYRYIFNGMGKLLFNADCKFLGKQPTYKGSMVEPTGMRHFTKVNVTLSQLNALVTEQLSDEQKKMMAGNQFSPLMNIDAKTGRVADVWFILAGDDNYRNRIPVETYRKIELALKEKVIFTVTEECRNYNNFFIYPVMIQF